MISESKKMIDEAMPVNDMLFGVVFCNVSMKDISPRYKFVALPSVGDAVLIGKRTLIVHRIVIDLRELPGIYRIITVEF